MKLTKTETGQLAFKERSPLFSVRQRSTFILFDGKKTTAQILASTATLGVTEDDVNHMVAQGFLTPVVEAPVAEPAPAAPAKAVAVAHDDDDDDHGKSAAKWSMF